MKALLSILIIFNLVVFPKLAFCGIIEKISNSQIAVELLTGRGESYGVNFSGWVGSLTFDAKEKLILISEFTNTSGNIHVINGVFKITKIEEYYNSIEFECVDAYDLTAGIEWRGKIWLFDSGKIKIEIVQKQSSRKWVNLSKYGKKFLKENNLEKLILGI